MLAAVSLNLSPGEQVIFEGHPSWRALLGFYLKGLLVAVILGVITKLASSNTAAFLVILVAFALIVLIGFVKRMATTYTITNQRLTIQTGILSRELHETRLERVQNVNATQSLFQRMLRVGTIDFDTAAGAEYDFTFRGVAEPHTIVRTVDSAIRELAGNPNV